MMEKKGSIFSDPSKDIDLSGKPILRSKMFAQASLGNKLSDIVQNLLDDSMLREHENRRKYVIEKFETSGVAYPVASIVWPNLCDKDFVDLIEAAFEGDFSSFASGASETHREYEYQFCGTTIKIYPPGNVTFATVKDTVDKELKEISAAIEGALNKLKV